MQVHTFKVEQGVGKSDDGIRSLYTEIKYDTQHLLQILSVEEAFVSLLATGGDLGSDDVFSFILERSGIDLDDEKKMSQYLQSHIPYERFIRQRHLLVTHKGILTSTMYKDVHCHMVTRNGEYVGHLLSYKQLSGVGVDDIYLSLSQNVDLTQDVLDIIINELISFVGDRRLSVASMPSMMSNVISKMSSD